MVPRQRRRVREDGFDLVKESFDAVVSPPPSMWCAVSGMLTINHSASSRRLLQ